MYDKIKDIIANNPVMTGAAAGVAGTLLIGGAVKMTTRYLHNRKVDQAAETVANVAKANAAVAPAPAAQ